MRQRSTIRDVALAAGVSIATVSRVLGNPTLVRSGTRARVMEVVKRLAYVPDGAARALASRKSMTVGCVVPTLEHAIFARLIQAMQGALDVGGYQLLIAAHDYVLDKESHAVGTLQQRGVDALALVGAHHSPTLWTQLLSWGKPSVLTLACDSRLPSVGIDNVALGRAAADHMLALGHRRIGVICGHRAQNDRQADRATGVRVAIERAGLRLSAELVSEQAFTIANGRAGLRALMAVRKPPTAIVCGNDVLATGALLEAQRAGIDVPRQLSISGIDNLDLSEAISPGLTTFQLPMTEMGQMAAERLMTHMAGQTIAAQTLLPFELVARGSTAPP